MSFEHVRPEHECSPLENNAEKKLRLELLKVYFQQSGIEYETSTKAFTQEMQFTLSGGYTLEFPGNFPKEMPVVCAPGGSRYDDEFYPGVCFDEAACKAVVNKVTEFLQNLSWRQASRSRYRSAPGNSRRPLRFSR